MCRSKGLVFTTLCKCISHVQVLQHLRVSLLHTWCWGSSSLPQNPLIEIQYELSFFQVFNFYLLLRSHVSQVQDFLRVFIPLPKGNPQSESAVLLCWTQPGPSPASWAIWWFARTCSRPTESPSPQPQWGWHSESVMVLIMVLLVLRYLVNWKLLNDVMLIHHWIHAG